MITIIELTYKKPLEQVNEYLQGHRDFLDKCYTDNLFIASGPKIPRDGGIILAMIDLVMLKETIKKDPFYQHDIADYRFTTFEATKYSEKFSVLLKN